MNLGSRTTPVTETHTDHPVANSVSVTDGDFVKLAQGGRVTNATIGTGKLFGRVEGGDNSNLVSKGYRNPVTVGDANGTTSVLVLHAEDQRFVLPFSAAAPAATAEGSYFSLTGSTGAQTVDTTTLSATAGQLLCVEAIKNTAGNITKGQFVVVNKTTDASA